MLEIKTSQDEETTAQNKYRSYNENNKRKRRAYNSPTYNNIYSNRAIQIVYSSRIYRETSKRIYRTNKNSNEL